LLHFGKAALAAAKAASTSASFASAISETFFSLPGEMESKNFFDFGAVNLPLMKRPYCGAMWAGAVSGAGSYSQRSPEVAEEEFAGRVVGAFGGHGQ